MFDQIMEPIQAALTQLVEMFKAFIQAIKDFADMLAGYVPEIPEADA